VQEVEGEENGEEKEEEEQENEEEETEKEDADEAKAGAEAEEGEEDMTHVSRLHWLETFRHGMKCRTLFPRHRLGTFSNHKLEGKIYYTTHF
jgi:hypothetical protein